MTDDPLRAALDEFFAAYDRTHLVHDVAYENVNDAVAALRLARRAALAASAPDEPRSDLRAALEHVLAAHLPHNMTCLTAAAALASAPDEGPT